jgi:hypothetical protein
MNDRATPLGAGISSEDARSIEMAAFTARARPGTKFARLIQVRAARTVALADGLCSATEA